MKSASIKKIFAICMTLVFLCCGSEASGADIVTIKPHGVPIKLRRVKQEEPINLPAPKSKDEEPLPALPEISPGVKSPDIILSSDVESSDKSPRDTIDALLKELTAPGNSKTPKPSLPPAALRHALGSSDITPTPTPYKSAALKDGKMSWPVTGKISSGYGRRGKRRRRMHTGIDIPMPAGTPIGSAADGVVADTGSSKSASYRGYGNTAVISHGDGVTTLYAHCQKLAVKKGQRVKRGDIIGYVGRTGRTTTAHVHFEVRKNGKPVNPLPYLTAR
ncbi:hypothetical protein FACS1894204_08890 [Synergistales bacterium]|nr:hypothetical protein FACS1894204_08890 [Synergistales bacterium]